MAERSRMLALFVFGGVGAVMACLGVRAALLAGSSSWTQALLVFVLCVFNVVFWILQVPVGRTNVSVSAVVSYLSVALLGPWPSIGLKVPGILAMWSSLRMDPRRKVLTLLVNLAVMSITILASGWAFAALGGGSAGHLSLRTLPAYLGMSTVYTVTNLALLAVVVNGLVSRQLVWSSFLDRLRQFWVNGILFALVGFLSQAMYAGLNWLGLVIAFGTLLATRFTFQLYAANQKTRSELAGVLTKALSYKDPYTAEHSQRVAAQAVVIGQQLGLSDQQLEMLHDAALLHDIGKVAVPDAVLVKPGPLDVEERRRMERHVGAGGELLEQSPHLRELADYVRAHHAHAGEEASPLIARIIAVADAFDAMTSDRPYRRALPLEEAMRRLKEGAGTQFDTSVVHALVRYMETSGHTMPLSVETREALAAPGEGGAGGVSAR